MMFDFNLLELVLHSTSSSDSCSSGSGHVAHPPNS